MADKPSDADQLFGALQGRDLTVSGRTWRVEVYSVRDVGGERWIQLALDGATRHTIALRLVAGGGLRPAVRVLSSWLSDPSIENAAILHHP